MLMLSPIVLYQTRFLNHFPYGPNEIYSTLSLPLIPFPLNHFPYWPNVLQPPSPLHFS